MYEIQPLPYEYDALEPTISSKTLHFHHDLHYQKYVDNLNNILKKYNFEFINDPVKIIQNIDSFDIKDRDDILFNLGGVINHGLYFYNMGKENNVPVGKLKEAINTDYGSYEKFKQAFIETANTLVGSGYTFLVINKNKKLEIINTSNQDNPYFYALIPIMTLDLWEHSYYLDYQNRRGEYINNFFNIIDFKKVNTIYEKNI